MSRITFSFGGFYWGDYAIDGGVVVVTDGDVSLVFARAHLLTKQNNGKVEKHSYVRKRTEIVEHARARPRKIMLL